MVWQCTAVVHDSGVVMHGSGAWQWGGAAWQWSGSPWQWCGSVWQWCSDMSVVWCDSCHCPAENLSVLSDFHYLFTINIESYLLGV